MNKALVPPTPCVFVADRKKPIDWLERLGDHNSKYLIYEQQHQNSIWMGVFTITLLAHRHRENLRAFARLSCCVCDAQSKMDEIPGMVKGS